MDWDDMTPRFDNFVDAGVWLYEVVMKDEPNVDNFRFAFVDDDELRSEGCCGEFDSPIFVDGKKAWIGCNYGH